MEFDINAKSVQTAARRYADGGRVVAEELRRGMTTIVFGVERLAKALSPVRTGHLRRSLVSRVVAMTGQVVGRVGTNVPYARIVHEGRGPVHAKRARYLRFVIDGVVYFRKSVGPAKANPFLRKAFDESRSTIDAALRATRRRVAARLSEGA